MDFPSYKLYRLGSSVAGLHCYAHERPLRSEAPSGEGGPVLDCDDNALRHRVRLDEILYLVLLVIVLGGVVVADVLQSVESRQLSRTSVEADFRLLVVSSISLLNGLFI